jgi:hypothetical protein
MSLLGQGLVAIWNDIASEGREAFYEWHNREHLPERIGIPGFIRGRRYIAKYGQPEYFTLHEAESPEVLSGQDYLNRLNNPTAWTQKIIPIYFRNMSRGICRVKFSLSCGDGGYLLTLRLAPVEGRESELETALRHHLLPPMIDAPGVVGVHLGIADIAASEIETAERKGQSAAIPRWLIMIEGTTDLAVDAACDRILANDLAKAVA